MATTTPNLGLTKPATSDNVDITVINTNMDKIDTAVSGTPNSLAIVSNGNTHTAISSGQYVYVRGHSSLSEGLYTATSAIPVNEPLSLYNVAAVSGGGLNALNNALNRIASGSIDVTGSASLADMMGRIVSSGTNVGVGRVGVADDGTLTGLLGATIYNYAGCRILYRGDMLYEIFAIPEWGETTMQKKYIYFEQGVQEWKLTAWETISA